MFSTLIAAQELQKLLSEQTDLVVFDVRHRLDNPDAGGQMYREGHIRGALFAHLDTDLAGPVGMTPSGHSGRHPLPAPDVWLKQLGDWGITPSTQVIAYDDAGGVMASRLWWMLRAVGHKAVAVLNGGLQAWTSNGGKLEAGEAKPARTAPPYPGRLWDTAIVTMDEVKAQVANPQPQRYLIVDARAANRYRGEVEPYGPVAGHIPGAKNAYYGDNLNPDGTFRSPAELRARFMPFIEAAGMGEIVMSCGSGVSACHNLLAIQIAGLPTAYLFPNSWSGWSATPGLPVATGEE